MAVTASIRGSVSFALVQVTKAQRARVAATLAEVGLHIGQEMVLMALWQQDGLSQSELMARRHVEAPTIAKAIARMDRAGLVRRERDGEDGRVSRVYLTERGRGLEPTVLGIWSDAEERLLQPLSDDERAQLRTLLGKLREAERS